MGLVLWDGVLIQRAALGSKMQAEITASEQEGRAGPEIAAALPPEAERRTGSPSASEGAT